MTRVRDRLIAIALLTLSVQTALLTLGAARVCWGDTHRHGGAAALECPMHHQDDVQRAHHGSDAHTGHDHADEATTPIDDVKRVTCDCSNDSISIYVGPAAVLTAREYMLPADEVVVVAFGNSLSPASVRFPPVSPPPRPRLSQLL